MNDQTIALLTTLSKKLGTTVDHLWGVLLAQVPIEIAISFGAIIVSALITFLVARATIKIHRDRDANTNPKESGANDLAGFISLMLTVIMTVVTLAVFCEKVTVLVTLIFNPEYWVLQHFIK